MAKMCVARSTSVAVSGWLRSRPDVHPFLLADMDRVHARRLPAHRVHSGGCDLDVLPIAEKPAEKPFRHRAPANISCTNEEDAFHDSKPARCRLGNVKSNRIKSTRTRGGEMLAMKFRNCKATAPRVAWAGRALAGASKVCPVGTLDIRSPRRLTTTGSSGNKSAKPR